MNQYLITAGEKIQCYRCTAKSSLLEFHGYGSVRRPLRHPFKRPVHPGLLSFWLPAVRKSAQGLLDDEPFIRARFYDGCASGARRTRSDLEIPCRTPLSMWACPL